MNITLADLKSEFPVDLACEVIADAEGFRSAAYPDANKGWDLPTIGYGTTVYPDGKRVQKGDTCDRTEAMSWLVSHVTLAVLPQMVRIPTWKRMNAHQQAAVISFAYNVGAYFYGSPGFISISNLLATPDKWIDAAEVDRVFCLYRNPGTVVESGLKARRSFESSLFCLPVHKEMDRLTALEEKMVKLEARVKRLELDEDDLR